jgi:hypothetical protein
VQIPPRFFRIECSPLYAERVHSEKAPYLEPNGSEFSAVSPGVRAPRRSVAPLSVARQQCDSSAHPARSVRDEIGSAAVFQQAPGVADKVGQLGSPTLSHMTGQPSRPLRRRLALHDVNGRRGVSPPGASNLSGVTGVCADAGGCATSQATTPLTTSTRLSNASAAARCRAISCLDGAGVQFLLGWHRLPFAMGAGRKNEASLSCSSDGAGNALTGPARMSHRPQHSMRGCDACQRQVLARVGKLTSACGERQHRDVNPRMACRD